MEHTREAGDPRSPKRQAYAPVQDTIHSAARAVASLDAAIWTSIIEFLPIPKEIQLVEKDDAKVSWDAKAKHNEAAVSEVVATWRTLLNLRFVTKELASLLHPVDNKQLWRRLLLQSFDFTSDEGGFNLENFQDDHGVGNNSDNEDNEDEDAEETRRSQRARARVQTDEENPQLVAMVGRYDSMPDNYLEEDLAEWVNLGISYRPSQYGFLTKVQQKQKSPEGEWPESEDPFTMFADLVRLLMLPNSEEMRAGGEAGDSTLKYLAAPTEAGSSSGYFRFYVMKTLGYVPHFWHWGSGISGEWKGFTETKAFQEAITRQLVDKHGRDVSDCSFDERGAAFLFPDCRVGDAKRLYHHLRQHCQDWRSVCCNSNSDGYTPVFFVGESRALPHRWIGYVGAKCWT